MGRPDPLESRYEGPWYREVDDLPTKGTAPITQYPKIKPSRSIVPQRGCPVTWPTLLHRHHNQDTTTDRTLTITNTLTISQTRSANSQTRFPSSRNSQEWFTRGPREEGDGHRPPVSSQKKRFLGIPSQKTIAIASAFSCNKKIAESSCLLCVLFFARNRSDCSHRDGNRNCNAIAVSAVHSAARLDDHNMKVTFRVKDC